jgi:DNA-directed RNA polymerase subunit RPC12/RpoP
MQTIIPSVRGAPSDKSGLGKYRTIVCPKCDTRFSSQAQNTAKCKSCGYRFLVTIQTIEKSAAKATIRPKEEYIDDDTEVAPKVPISTLFTSVSPLTGLKPDISPTTQKFIEMGDIEPLLEMGKGVFSKIGLNIDDLKGIVESLNKIATKRGWVNKFGGMSDNEDEIDLFFKIFNMASGGIQNFLAKKEMEKQMKDIGNQAANFTPQPEPAQEEPATVPSPVIERIAPILQEQPKVRKKYRHHPRRN